jgi:hypothetical protein
MPQQPTRQPRKHFHLAWLLVIIIPGYLIGGLLCRGQTTADCCVILLHTTEIVALSCAVPVGISYGMQEDKFWT